MKKFKLILGLSLLLIGITHAQSTLLDDHFPVRHQKILYQDIVKVDKSLTKDQLIANLTAWIEREFLPKKVEIKTDDSNAEESIFIITSHFNKSHHDYIANPKNRFTLTVEIKDARYRYTLSEITYEYELNEMGKMEQYNYPLEDWMFVSFGRYKKHKIKKKQKPLSAFCNELDKGFNKIISSLKNGMLDSENSDW